MDRRKIREELKESFPQKRYLTIADISKHIGVGHDRAKEIMEGYDYIENPRTHSRRYIFSDVVYAIAGCSM